MFDNHRGIELTSILNKDMNITTIHMRNLFKAVSIPDSK